MEIEKWGANVAREISEVGFVVAGEAARLVNADAEALIRDHGGAAYREARRRARDVILPDGTTHQSRTPAH